MWAIEKRPKTFSEVIGQQDAINTLMQTKDEATTYILHGSSGVGKTTLARIFANEQDAELIEINGADNNGVDSIRALVDMAMYVPAFTSKRAFIIDECFHSSTKVTMEDSSTQVISSIKVGDKVKNLVGSGEVTSVFKNLVTLDRLVLVKLANGKELLTTKDHLFFTKDGWVEAKLLQKGEFLYGSIEDEGMCDLSQGVRNKVGCDELFIELQKSTYQEVSEGISSNFEGVTNSKGSFPSNVEIESNGERIHDKEDGRHEKGKWNFELADKKSWGKWEDYNPPTKIERCSRGGLCIGVGDKDSQNEGGWLPTLIQSRPRISKEYVGDRGGWESPSLEKEYSQRLKENTTSRGIRVESVEIYESTNRRESFRSYIKDIDISLGYIELFDLEITNHPSYYVENVLVHNCHMLTVQAWNALLKILEEAPKTTLWLLCTTEYSKIPLTIKSRSISIRLRDINKSTMKSYLQSVARSHTSFEVTGEVLDAIVSRSEGRVREALTTLETYVTTGVLDYKFDTLDIIHFIGHLFKGEAMKLQSYLDDLTNEDVYAIINFVKDYMKFLMIFPQSGGMKAEEVLDKYTSISSTHLNVLREMQQEIWQACPYDGEPMPTTVRYLYEVYDVMMKHYNDFRDSRSAFEIALYAIMEGTKNG